MKVKLESKQIAVGSRQVHSDGEKIRADISVYIARGDSSDLKETRRLGVKLAQWTKKAQSYLAMAKPFMVE